MSLDPGIDEQASCRQCGGTYTFYERNALEVCVDCGHQRKNREPWYRRAACRNSDTNLFFPKRGDITPVTAARAICATCPVKTECLQYALDTVEMAGIWGGTTERERRRLRRDRPAATFTKRCVNCRQQFTTTNRGKQWCGRDCYSRYKQHPARRRIRA